MAKGGRPRKHDPLADDISFAIEAMKNKEAISLLTDVSVDILDGEGRTPLIYASFSGNLEILQWLIHQGAQLDVQDRNGFCALHAASQNGHVKVLEVLLRSGANPNLTDAHGNGPLWTATIKSRGDDSVPSLLIHHGADPDHMNNAGKSPKDAMALIRKNLKLMADQRNNDQA
ncbi:MULTISPECIES: ankyrin repeat domain-containing protein [unclassified Marinobacter]|jgi:ankyrin repeat protein|uniref:ankyrin repeat domain-containing protein n=1 Tax=unclassified Marinobacter TaxID=83889 RepID=UPI0012680D72|nr:MULTISPECIES: ankyrin repeat domain-containing protein [unclassified Marinobacter]